MDWAGGAALWGVKHTWLFVWGKKWQLVGWLVGGWVGCLFFLQEFSQVSPIRIGEAGFLKCSVKLPAAS